MKIVDKKNVVPVAAQQELERHSWGQFAEGDTFTMAQGGNGVVVIGCVACHIWLNTIPHFLQDLSERVLPQIIDTVLERTAIAES